MKPPLAAAIVTAAIGLGAFWAIGMRPASAILALGEPMPAFSLAEVEGIDRPGFASDALVGAVTVVNLFASWCGPCRQEHPLLLDLGQRAGIRLVGINVQDLPENAVQFLDELGNPYAAVGSDANGELSDRLGIVGLPHSYVLDAAGRLILSYPGPLTQAIVSREILSAENRGRWPPE